MALGRTRLRITALWRTIINPALLNPGSTFDSALNNGEGIVPATDQFGIPWVRIVAGAAGSAVAALQLVTQALLATFSADGALFVSGPGNWSVTSDPAVNTQATVTRAGVVGVSHVCTSIGLCLSNSGAAASAIVKAYLRDGASGVGAVLWSANIIAGPGFGDYVHISGLNIVGTAGNAMTLEFAAAGGANTQENVSLTGYDA